MAREERKIAKRPKKTRENGLTSSCCGSQSTGRIRSVLDMENRQCFYGEFKRKIMLLKEKHAKIS